MSDQLEGPIVSVQRVRMILRFVETNSFLPADVTAVETEALDDLFYEEDGHCFLTSLGELELGEPEILSVKDVGSHRQHSISGLSVEEIAALIGFPANVEDDPNKVKFSWGFTVNGKACAVWDWKGSHHLKEFSAYGPVAELRLVFGDSLRSEPIP